MSAEQNKAVVRRFYETFEANDVSALEALLSPDLAAYSHGQPGPMNRSEHVQAIATWNTAFGTRFTVEEHVAEGDKVATRVTMRATHNKGEFMGISPSGKEITATGISIEHIKNGKIVERRVESDWLGMMRQLGLIPELQAAG